MPIRMDSAPCTTQLPGNSSKQLPDNFHLNSERIAHSAFVMSAVIISHKFNNALNMHRIVSIQRVGALASHLSIALIALAALPGCNGGGATLPLTPVRFAGHYAGTF